jgi:hypothetical protein
LQYGEKPFLHGIMPHNTGVRGGTGR